MMSPSPSWRPDQFHVAHAKSRRELIKADNRWIAMALFEATNVLLTEPRAFRELLLRQTPSLSDPPDIFSNQPAHVHVRKSADYIL
jgi:hypothetical protein